MVGYHIGDFVGAFRDNHPILLTLIFGGKFMKIVVVKSPKMLKGILRAIFKIKKDC
ncbi:MAG: stage V sporulation protein SpoVM [Clostridia bacterium]|nr:stage V sporulation protein SpoVM [Clostridia bacterium]